MNTQTITKHTGDPTDKLDSGQVCSVCAQPISIGENKASGVCTLCYFQAGNPKIGTLLIAGGRDLLSHMSEDVAFMKLSTAIFVNFHVYTPENIGRVIHGNAQGADITGGNWAKKMGIQCDPDKDVFRAKWDDLDATPCVVRYNRYEQPYNALAGHNRNSLMRDQATHAVVFWDGKSKGTKDMITKLKTTNIPHVIINY